MPAVIDLRLSCQPRFNRPSWLLYLFRRHGSQPYVVCMGGLGWLGALQLTAARDATLRDQPILQTNNSPNGAVAGHGTQ